MIVRAWRVARAEPYGLVMWFDPTREIPMIRETTPGEQLLWEGFEKGMEPSEDSGVVTPEGGAAPMVDKGSQLPLLFGERFPFKEV